MLNEILTGQATLENKPKPAVDPYRTPGQVPPAICIGCGQPFPANQAIAGRCRSCIRQSNQPVSQLLDQDPGRFQYISTRNPDLSWTVLRIIIAIVVIVGLALFRFGMRESMRNDYREANGVHTYEDYSR